MSLENQPGIPPNPPNPQGPENDNRSENSYHTSSNNDDIMKLPDDVYLTETGFNTETFRNRINMAFWYSRQRVRPDTARPPLLDQDTDILIANMTGMQQDILKHYKSQTFRPNHIKDKRFKKLEFSLAYWCLMWIGAFDDGKEPIGPLGTRSEYTSVGEVLRAIAMGVKIRNNGMVDFRERVKMLQGEILRHAHVVVCTMACMNESLVYENIRPRLIVADEAAQSAESTCWGMFAHFPETDCFLLCGDERQLTPLVLSDDKINPFANQRKLSLFNRLILAGLPSTFLPVQQRMHPAISDPINKTFYQGKLIDGHNVLVPSTTTQNIQAFNRSRFSEARNDRNGLPFLVIDVNKSQSDRERGSKSIHNENHVKWICELVFDLVSSGTVTGGQILIVTPYDAAIVIFLGAEADVVIANLPSTRGAGFMKHPGRVSSMLSRAKFAQYFVVNAGSMNGWKASSSGRFLQRYIHLTANMQVPSSAYRPRYRMSPEKMAQVFYGVNRRQLISIIMEAKKASESKSGFAQAPAYMAGVQQRRMRLEPSRLIDTTYGIVSDGINWQFMRLNGKMLRISKTFSMLFSSDRPCIYRFVDAVIKSSISLSPHTTPERRFPGSSQRWQETIESGIFGTPTRQSQAGKSST